MKKREKCKNVVFLSSNSCHRERRIDHPSQFSSPPSGWGRVLMSLENVSDADSSVHAYRTSFAPGMLSDVDYAEALLLRLQIHFDGQWCCHCRGRCRKSGMSSPSS